MADGGSLRHASRRGRNVHVPGPVLGVPELSLGLEDAEQRAHRGRMRRIVELLADLPRSRSAKAIDHIHDLAFTPRECGLLSGHGTKTYLSRMKKATAIAVQSSRQHLYRL